MPNLIRVNTLNLSMRPCHPPVDAGDLARSHDRDDSRISGKGGVKPDRPRYYVGLRLRSYALHAQHVKGITLKSEPFALRARPR